MRVIFLNRFFHPDHSATSQLLTELALGLVQAGHQITVVTSRQRYDSPGLSLPVRETIEGVEVHRVWTTGFGRAGLFGRAMDYATFYLSAALKIARIARRGDVIVAETDPPVLSIIAYPVARLRGARLVNWLQDIFPEVAIALGMGRGRLARPLLSALTHMRDRTLAGAACNVVLGEAMQARVRAQGVPSDRVAIIPNWADGRLIHPIAPGENRLRAEWGLGTGMVVGYSGNLGRAHEYGTLLEAITGLERRAAEAPRGAGPTWLFIGGGALFDAFRDDVKRRGLTSVRFMPYQARERLAESLSAADVHLVSLRPELEGLIVPSKVYGIMAAGRPAIFIGSPEGEVAEALRRFDCGVSIAEGDHEALMDAIVALGADPERREAMGRRAREAFSAEYDLPVAIQSWRRLLAGLDR